MADTITGEQILARAIRNGGLGKVLANAEIGSLSASAVVSVLHLRDNSGVRNTAYYRNRHTHIYWPGNPSGLADYDRLAGLLTLSTGSLAPDTNWSNGTLGSSNMYLLYDDLKPVDVVDALNDAMRTCYFPCEEPLSTKPIGTGVADAGFQSSATTNYTLVGSGTFTKASTANSENIYPGMISSGFIDAGAAGDYIFQRFDVTPGETVNVFVLSRLATGTNAQLILWDVTNSAQIGDTIEHAQEQWQWMRHVSAAIPSTCKTLEVRLAGEGASDDVYANAFIVYRTRNRRMILDTTWNTEFKMPSLYTVDFMGSGSSGENNVYDGFSTHLTPIPNIAYQFAMNRPGANPYAIQFNTDEYFDRPIYIQGRRAYGDLTTFTLALSETTACDLDLIEAALRVEIFNGVGRGLPDAAEKLAAAKKDFADANRQFKIDGPAPAKELTRVMGVRN